MLPLGAVRRGLAINMDIVGNVTLLELLDRAINTSRANVKSGESKSL